MFEIKGETEIKDIRLRMEAHDDTLQRCMFLKVAIADTDAANLDSAVPDMLAAFFDHKEPRLQEIYPLKVAHHIDNCVVMLSTGKGATRKKIKLDGCDLSKISITPRYGGHAELGLTLKVVPLLDGVTDQLHKWLRGIVMMEIKEKQLDLPAMNQPAAAGG